jgi:antitoxin HicB
MRKYTIILDPDTEEGGYTVTVPALPGCITQGETPLSSVLNVLARQLLVILRV